jgi:hypothetical protein
VSQRPTKVAKHEQPMSNEERWASQYERVKVKVPRGQAGVDTLNNYRQIANLGLGAFYPATSTSLRGDAGDGWGGGGAGAGGSRHKGLERELQRPQFAQAQKYAQMHPNAGYLQV